VSQVGLDGWRLATRRAQRRGRVAIDDFIAR
jgi:hypothetical protein